METRVLLATNCLRALKYPWFRDSVWYLSQFKRIVDHSTSPASLMVLRIAYSQRPLPDAAVMVIWNYGNRHRALTCCIRKAASFLRSITASN